MKSVEYNLPFGSENYLQSFTERIADNPHVILITAVQNSEEEFVKCKITFKNHPNIENEIFHVGTLIGAHAQQYSENRELKKEAFSSINSLVKDFLEALTNSNKDDGSELHLPTEEEKKETEKLINEVEEFLETEVENHPDTLTNSLSDEEKDEINEIFSELNDYEDEDYDYDDENNDGQEIPNSSIPQKYEPKLSSGPRNLLRRLLDNFKKK